MEDFPALGREDGTRWFLGSLPTHTFSWLSDNEVIGGKLLSVTLKECHTRYY